MKLTKSAQQHGQLRIYVPKVFTATHPAVQYQRSVISQPIAAHPIGSQFIKTTCEPSIQPLEKNLRYFMAPEDFPESIDGLVQTDKAQLALVVTSFDDATLVSIAFPHTLLDGNGFVNLVQNWSLVLAGKEDEVAPFLDPQTDALEDLVAADTSALKPEDCRMEKMRIKGFALWKYLGRQMAEAVQRKRRLQALYIPQATYRKLLEKFREEGSVLEVNEADEKRREDEAHVLTAWLIKVIAAQESAPRPVTLLTLYDLRDHIRALKDASQRGHFAQGLVTSSCAMFPAGTHQTPIGDLVRAYKEQVAALTTEEEALAFMKQWRSELRKKKPDVALYGSTDSLLVFYDPVAKLDPAKMADFGPAVMATSGGDETSPGRVSGNVFNPLDWTDAGVDLLLPLGHDYEGGYWITAKLSTASWNSVAQQLRDL